MISVVERVGGGGGDEGVIIRCVSLLGVVKVLVTSLLPYDDLGEAAFEVNAVTPALPPSWRVRNVVERSNHIIPSTVFIMVDINQANC